MAVSRVVGPAERQSCQRGDKEAVEVEKQEAEIVTREGSPHQPWTGQHSVSGNEEVLTHLASGRRLIGSFP